ncbi:uncharacterized protein CXQ87_004688 [Candidozyma duobushaemuli]|uniref:Uncharacterized protein n=1 Tax=Candidozyma duobushaemuli TaxID=1231522 RepID=A0A2V1ADH0_9ASCO|nr:uncharacterized protein CXQ87_004688 [[Candida] duobushaemulonis]PVH16397.1 hypothetical protein CXQ87_004688 [[Candida] duobushaemulonis]
MWWKETYFTDFSLSEEEAVTDENDPVLSFEGTVEYLFTEMSKCFFEEQSQFASKQIGRILHSNCVLNLSAIPESDDHFTMDVISGSCYDLTDEALTPLIRRCAWGSAKMYKENIQTISDRMNVLFERHYRGKLLQKEESTYEEGLSLALDLEEANELIDCHHESLDKKIHDLMSKNGEMEDPELRARFAFTKSELTLENFLWAKVLYKPTSRAQSYFKNNFLNPHDKILSWLNRDKIQATWEQADVLVRLGLDMVPPKRATVDRIRRNLKYALQKSPSKRKLSAVVSSIERAKPYRVVYDTYDMSCCIRFCYMYCSYCHLTGHTYDECPEIEHDD